MRDDKDPYALDRLVLEPKTAWTRREFVVSTLATGFALAVQPALAQTAIVTSADGLTVGEVNIPVKGGTIPAYRAMPAGAHDAPLILVVHEIFGVHEHIQDVCRRLAKLGAMAVAPYLFARQGDVSKLSDIRQIMDQIVSKVPDSDVMQDLDATVDWAQQNGAHPSKLGITGFCWGGRIVWLYCGNAPEVKAGAAWYGRLIDDYNELHPVHPIDVAPTLKVPVVGLYGGNDPSIPLKDIEEMRKRLQYSGSHSFIRIFPAASHAFFADYRSSYDKKSAEAAWQQMLKWFNQYGVF
ncbi:MAG TPA: dienelactone hydrolase family protein [Burkholderiales bacterium]|nr:dienelactone hydrolase family protein [Burkholderiales bacterium]